MDLKNLFQQHETEFQSIAQSKEFYFTKAKEVWDEWDNYKLDPNFLAQLISMDYEDFKNSNDNNIIKIKDLLFRLISYCDVNASGKNQYNDYPDKRTIATTGIRQNAWITQLLKYKESPTSITDSISNIIKYIQDPKLNLPILSEVHKELISNNLFEIPYNRQDFHNSVINLCDSYNINCHNEENKTLLYARLIYQHKEMWYKNAEIQGLITRDSTNWTEEFLEDISSSSSGYGVLWRNTLPTGKQKIIEKLRNIINEGNTFDFYFVKDNLTTYKAIIEDFATKEEYPNIKNKWESKQPIWFNKDFSKYKSEKQQAKVVFLVKAFEKIPRENQLHINNFEIFEHANAYINNYVAYTNINKPESNTMTDLIVKILEQKKNIILQGAPGTGKTYTTATIALKALGIKDIDWNNHDEIMTEYSKLVDDNRIAFTTFHQSMDYEDFVEGYKPIKNNNSSIEFELKPGIFRKICEQAEKNNSCVLIIDEINRGNISKIFGELITLLEADKRSDGNHTLKVSLTYSQEQFTVPGNLYIIGTMNTTDRSVGSIDYALRRRFTFFTLTSNKDVIEEYYNDVDLKDKALFLYDNVKTFLENHRSDINISDLMPGHSYFMAKSLEEFEIKIRYELIPLIEEYAKDGIIEASEEELYQAFDEWKQAAH
jgi:MoxR-like ATPase